MRDRRWISNEDVSEEAVPPFEVERVEVRVRIVVRMILQRLISGSFQEQDAAELSRGDLR